MIRDLNVSDVNDVMALCHKFYAEYSAHVPHQEYDVAHTQQNVLNALMTENALSLGYYRKERLVGYIFGIRTRNILSPRLIGQEIGFYVERSARGPGAVKLVREFERRIDTDLVVMSSIDDYFGGVLARMGYDRAETSFIKRVR